MSSSSSSSSTSPRKRKAPPNTITVTPEENIEPDERQRLENVLREITGAENVVIVENAAVPPATAEVFTVRVPRPNDDLGLKIIRFRISPPGDGKSQLDQHFGHIKRLRDRNLNRGQEGINKADNAHEMATLIFNTGNGITQTTGHVIAFNRRNTHKKDPSLPSRIKKIMTVTKEIERLPNGDLVFREHTGFGNGIVLSVKDQEMLWTNDIALKGAVPALAYTTVAIPSAGDTKLVQYARTIKSEKTREIEQSKKLQKKTARLMFIEKQSAIQSSTASGQALFGLHRCNVTNANGAMCTAVYTRSCGLKKHTSKNTHTFPSAFNVTPELAVGNFASSPDALAAAYSTVNVRLTGIADRVELLLKSRNDNMQRTIVSAQYPGNARTGMEKKKIVYKTLIQIQELKAMYMEGVNSSGKTVTPEVAYERMKTKVTVDGIRFYSKSSENGELLNVNQIKQYFSKLHSAYNKNKDGSSASDGRRKKQKRTLDESSTLTEGVLKGLGAATVQLLLPTIPTFGALARMKNELVNAAAHVLGSNLAKATQKLLTWREAAREKLNMPPYVEEEGRGGGEEEDVGVIEMTVPVEEGESATVAMEEEEETIEEWNAYTVYAKGDVIDWDGTIWKALVDEPTESEEDWGKVELEDEGE
jgi:hypothetical protein